MRSLLRRYPDFPDMRAALTAAQWAAGREGDAETNWQRVEDPRWVMCCMMWAVECWHQHAVSYHCVYVRSFGSTAVWLASSVAKHEWPAWCCR